MQVLLRGAEVPLATLAPGAQLLWTHVPGSAGVAGQSVFEIP